MGAIRPLWKPEHRPSREGPRRVVGGVLSLEAKGPAPSAVDVGVTKNVKLLFHGGYYSSIRGKSEPDEVTPFAELTGTVTLLEDQTPLIECDPETLTHEEPESEDDVDTVLALFFSSANFRVPPEFAKTAAPLRLPRNTTGSRFFELSVGIEVDGAVESEARLGHRLDVALRGPATRIFFDSAVHLSDVAQALTLTADEGGYSATLQVAQFDTNPDGGAEALFEGLVPNKSYTLRASLAGGLVLTVFESIPFSSLVKAHAAAPSPQGDPSDVTEPEWAEALEAIQEEERAAELPGEVEPVWFDGEFGASERGSNAEEEQR